MRIMFRILRMKSRERSEIPVCERLINKADGRKVVIFTVRFHTGRKIGKAEILRDFSLFFIRKKI